jgi:hypothetical protein
MNLGEITRTRAGLQVVDFVDAAGNACSLEQTPLEGGTDSVWLGTHSDAGAAAPRMELDRELAARVASALVCWLAVGRFGNDTKRGK